MGESAVSGARHGIVDHIYCNLWSSPEHTAIARAVHMATWLLPINMQYLTGGCSPPDWWL